MRKLILELEPNEIIKTVLIQLFEKLESIELLEMLRKDYEEGKKIGLMVLRLKEDIPIEEVKLPDNIKILNILKSEGNKHTCVVMVQDPEDVKNLIKNLKLNLIWTTPIIISEEKFIYSCIGEQKDISEFIELMKKYGTILNMRFQKAAYQEHDILSVLTDKQREILIVAEKHGYYKYPRKINSEALAQKIGISKGTMVEHLRKAEERLVTNIVAGYSIK
jgi:predicted DNA binding protein